MEAECGFATISGQKDQNQVLFFFFNLVFYIGV